MDTIALNKLSARQAASSIKAGELTAVELLEACIHRIEEREPLVQAWSYLDLEGARAQARAADELTKSGAPLGLLHGVPIGIKDVFDTCDMPSEYGSSLYQGRRPDTDAAAVKVLRDAGAVIVGKTTTSEFGMYHPSKTKNPHDLNRSPGVSSAGAAASVVDYMVPLGLGTQHTASTTLPASFCGAYAFKPSLGFTDMTGSNILVPRLSHLGLLARSIDDLALFAGVYQEELCNIEQPVAAPRIAFVRGPGWDLASQDAQTACEKFIDSLDIEIPLLPMDSALAEAPQVTMQLLSAHMAHRFCNLSVEELAGLCPPLQECINDGRKISAAEYIRLQQIVDGYCVSAREVFQNYDAVITLSTCGEATLMEEGPGSGVMSMFWSLCGLPTVSMPLLKGKNNLPIGLQIISSFKNDKRVLEVASFIDSTFRASTQSVLPK